MHAILVVLVYGLAIVSWLVVWRLLGRLWVFMRRQERANDAVRARLDVIERQLRRRERINRMVEGN